MIDGGAQPYLLPYRSAIVVLDSTGTELKRFGRFGNHDGQFIMGHDIALDPDGNVLVSRCARSASATVQLDTLCERPTSP